MIGEGPLTTTKTLNFVIMGSDSPHNIIIGRTTMQQMGIVVSTIHGAIKFYTPQGIGTVLSQYNPREPEEERRATSEEHQEEAKDILSFVDAEERILVNNQNIEVNAEDIVIKSNVEEEMLADIKETLDGLRAINLKHNPKKCSFGIEEGIFSGHLITKQGIKASPSKVKAISDLQPRKTISEIQNLNRKLAALNRFLSKGEDKMLPFMRTLKSCTSGKWSNGQRRLTRPFKE
ncbi:hypothetical protein Tco_0780752 [Tanacetum coccineum]